MPVARHRQEIDLGRKTRPVQAAQQVAREDETPGEDGHDQKPIELQAGDRLGQFRDSTGDGLGRVDDLDRFRSRDRSLGAVRHLIRSHQANSGLQPDRREV